MAKIVTHTKPNHIDEVFATAISLTSFKVDRIEVVRDISQAHLEPGDIVLDIGGKLGEENGVLFFDHHQDVNLPSTFVLVLRYLGLDITQYPEIFEDYLFLSEKDAHGPKAAEKAFNTRYLGNPTERILVKIFENSIVDNKIEDVEDIRIFSSVGEAIIEEIRERLDAAEKYKKLRCDENGIIWVKDDPFVNLTLLAKIHPGAVGVVSKNSRGGFSITRLSHIDPSKFSPRKFAEERGLKITFEHATGFMCVVEDI